MPDRDSWKLLPIAPAGYVAGMLPSPPLVSQLLYNRGIADAAEAESFLNPGQHLLADPFLLPDMEKAVARISRALLSAEKIAVWGDFDVDGMSGAALLVEGLSSLGGNVIPYIPHRVEEGYGLNHKGLKELRQRGVSLVITVDCGIGAVSEVKYAREIGLDVIVTDHHTVSSVLPPAVAVVDPKRVDSRYPFADLAGVGVAFKLLQAQVQTLGRFETWDDLLDLVALGTVADMMPLVGENRYLVKRGLELLNDTRRVGLREMMSIAGLQWGELDTEGILWVLAPRLNTAGRLTHALTAYQLLVTRSQQEAHQLALELEQENAERKRITDDVWDKARNQIMAAGADQPLLIAEGEDYHPGVLGIVASRLVDEFHRPAAVIRLEPEVSKGSARSIPQFNFVAALMECRDILQQFGGHPMAAGFTLPGDKVGQLRQCLQQMAASQLDPGDLQPQLLIDADVQLRDLNGDMFKLLRQFAPFGRANPEPTFLSRDVEVVDCRSVGKGGEHLRLKLRDGSVTWDGVGFNLGQFIAEVTPRLDAVYKLAVDRWDGQEALQLNIIDFAPPTSA